MQLVSASPPDRDERDNIPLSSTAVTADPGSGRPRLGDPELFELGQSQTSSLRGARPEDGSILDNSIGEGNQVCNDGPTVARFASRPSPKASGAVNSLALQLLASYYTKSSK